jgi:ABC-type multidrug transport system ATPase subunit
MNLQAVRLRTILVLILMTRFAGLDAYNAYNVVESLVSLARNYNRTVVFTIHQPRSNIVALFDQLVLLAQGRLVYAGEFAKCQPYFDSIGQHCPPGFNIADYLSARLLFYKMIPSTNALS